MTNSQIHTTENVRETWRRLADADCRKSLPTKGAIQEALQQVLAALDEAESILAPVDPGEPMWFYTFKQKVIAALSGGGEQDA